MDATPHVSLRVTLRGHEAPVTEVSFSPDGTLLASSSKDRTVLLWDVATWTGAKVLRGHSAEVTSVQFSPKGSMVASASRDNTVRCWLLDDGSERWRFHGPTDFRSVAWSPDETYVGAIQTMNIHLFNVATGALDDILARHQHLARRALWLPDGTLVSAGKDGLLALWTVPTGQTFHEERVPGGIHNLAHDPRRNSLAAGCADGSIRLWSVDPWQELAPPRATPTPIHHLSFCADGRHLAATDANRKVTLHTATLLSSCEIASARFAVFHPKKAILAAVQDETIQILDVDLQALSEAMNAEQERLAARQRPAAQPQLTPPERPAAPVKRQDPPEIRATPELAPTVAPVTTILFLAAEPTTEARLQSGKESREIKERILSAEYRDRFRFEREDSVRVGDITRYMLRHKPTIVHFSGHGEAAGGLIFEKDTGEGQAVSPEALSRLFKVFKRTVRCVVLNACYTEATAALLRQHVDCVVGMSTAITDDAATCFAWAFYEALASGENVETAFDLAVAQIDLQGFGEEDTPKLVFRDGVTASDVRL